MRRNKIRELKVETGDYMRISHIPVRRTGSHKRGRRFAPTSKAQQKINQRNAEYKLQELIQLNFPRGSGALVIGADYDNEHKPTTCEEGVKEFGRYIRRINTALKKKGAPSAKYIYVTAYGTRSGRVHHHCVISCDLTAAELRRLWYSGRVHVDPIYYDVSGMVGLSDYLARQSGVTRRWNSSKGLKRPEVVKNDNAVSLRDARYIANNPWDVEYIERMYPGWRVYKVIPAAEPEDGGGGLPGIYNTILMYRDGMSIGYDYSTG